VAQKSARRVALMRCLCGVGALLSVIDLDRTAVTTKGPRFLRTRFTVRDAEGFSPVYYCRCGQMAFRTEPGGEFVAL